MSLLSRLLTARVRTARTGFRRRTRFVVLLAVAALVLSFAPAASADEAHPGVTPQSVEVTVFPGEDVDVAKTVHVPEIPPDADVYFLVDTTGSMVDVLNQIIADIGLIIPGIQAEAPTARFGLGEYKDFPIDPFAFNQLVALGPDDGPGGAFDVSDAVAGLAPASGGGDGPEGQFYALDQLASAANPAGFDPATPSIVVWIGDAPAHDPVCSAISGLGYDIDEASLTAKLQAPGWGAGGISTVAISTVTAAGAFYPDALDDDPTAFAGDYLAACGVENGAAMQATRITAATGGAHLTGVLPADIADAIVAAVGSVEVEVSMVSDCVWPITTTFVPATQTVASGGHAVFTETIAVAGDAPGGTYTCRDYPLIDGSRILDAEDNVVFEDKTVHVPEGFLTGGGQIGKGSKGQQFGGNVGFLADGTIVGQWQFSDGALKLKMHSTGWTSLQFSKNAGPDPDPPDANANVADFAGTARVKVANGPWDDTCTFVAQAQDHGEPGRGVDVFGIQITCGGDVWTFGRELIDAGNLQIHAGVKE